VPFGIERDADVGATAIVDRGIEGVDARVSTPRGDVDLATPLVGRANLANVLGDGGRCRIWHSARCDRGASRTLRPHRARGEIVRLPRRHVMTTATTRIRCDARALEVLRTAEGASRRVAVLGEMLELGDRAVALQRRWAPWQPRRVSTAANRWRRAAMVWLTRRSRRACRATAYVTWRRARSGEPGGAGDRPGDLVLVKGCAASEPMRSERLKAELPDAVPAAVPFHTELSVLNVTRYIPFGRAAICRRSPSAWRRSG